MRCLRILGVAVALLPAAAPAQESRRAPPRLEQVRAGLRSDDEAELLWAAWRAGEDRQPALAPDVAQAMARLAGRPGSGLRGRLAQTLGVALLQTGAKVSATDLRAWWEQLPAARDALVVLAAAQPRVHAELLRALAADVGPSLAWVCACNVLLESDPAWIARQLLRTVTLDVELRATTGEAGQDPNFGFLYQGGMECGRWRVPDDLPPISQCRLTWLDDPATLRDGPALLLARGPRPVGWSHRVRGDGSSFCNNTATVVGCRSYALACLHHLAGAPDCPDLADTIQCPDLFDAAIRWNIPWRDAATWKEQATQKLAAFRTQWGLILAGLRTKGLLPEPAATWSASLRVQVRDDRVDKTTPLPKIGPP